MTWLGPAAGDVEQAQLPAVMTKPSATFSTVASSRPRCRIAGMLALRSAMYELVIMRPSSNKHFLLRRVALGDCRRPYGTPCVHEHAGTRCPFLRVDPAQLGRIEEMTSNAEARLEEVREKTWLGEVAALEESLKHLRLRRQDAPDPEQLPDRPGHRYEEWGPRGPPGAGPGCDPTDTRPPGPACARWCPAAGRDQPRRCGGDGRGRHRHLRGVPKAVDRRDRPGRRRRDHHGLRRRLPDRARTPATRHRRAPPQQLADPRPREPGADRLRRPRCASRH